MEDRISELPEGVLHHILSFLLIKDAAPTSLVSKRWYRVWSTLPFIDIGTIVLEESSSRRESFFASLDRALLNRKRQGSTIHKFSITVPLMDGPDFDRFIDRLVDCNIKELFLKSINHLRCYTLPPTLFTAKSALSALSLHCCRLPPSTKLFSCLRKLHLEWVSLDDEHLRDINDTCRSLEEFHLVQCYGFNKTQLQISSGLLELKRLRLALPAPHPNRLQVVDKVEVDAPNLETFSYDGGDVPRKIRLSAAAYKTLKCLSFRRANIINDDNTNKWLQELIPKVILLEKLSLDHSTGGKGAIIEISSSSLRHLDLLDCKGEAKVDAPNLQFFKYSGYLTIKVAKNLSMKEVELELYPPRAAAGATDDGGDSWFPRLVQFLSQFKLCQVVKLLMDRHTNHFIIPKETRSRLLVAAPPPLEESKHLEVEAMVLNTPSVGGALTELVDSSMWMSPRLESLSIELESLTVWQGDEFHRVELCNVSIKFLYDDEDDDRLLSSSCGCCSCSMMMNNKLEGGGGFAAACWRHPLQVVKIEKLNAAGMVVADNAEVERCLRNYFTENAHFLKEIHFKVSSSSSELPVYFVR